MPDDERECPMCGTAMHIKIIESTVHVPGDPTPMPRPVREWVCPECDYFEEAETDGR